MPIHEVAPDSGIRGRPSRGKYLWWLLVMEMLIRIAPKTAQTLLVMPGRTPENWAKILCTALGLSAEELEDDYTYNSLLYDATSIAPNFANTLIKMRVFGKYTDSAVQFPTLDMNQGYIVTPLFQYLDLAVYKVLIEELGFKIEGPNVPVKQSPQWFKDCPSQIVLLIPGAVSFVETVTDWHLDSRPFLDIYTFITDARHSKIINKDLATRFKLFGSNDQNRFDTEYFGSNRVGFVGLQQLMPLTVGLCDEVINKHWGHFRHATWQEVKRVRRIHENDLLSRAVAWLGREK